MYGRPDAIVFDLASRTPADHREEARCVVPDVLRHFAVKEIELLLWTDGQGVASDIESCAPGSFIGVVLSCDDPTEVQAVDRALTEWESSHGIPTGALTIELVFSTNKAVQNVERLATASSRIVALAMDDEMLLEEMRATPSSNQDRLLYHRGRISIAAASVGLQAHALGYANGTVEDRAQSSREAGFRGALCFDSHEVASCNAGFSPSRHEVDTARLIQDAMHSAIEDGKGAVAVSQGQMADLANVRGALATIAWSDAVKKREDPRVSGS